MTERVYYPLTSPQLSIWYQEKMYPGTSIGNIAATLRFKGQIDYDLLEKAINLTIETNDALRLRMIEKDGEPKQYVSQYEYHKFQFYDFCDKELSELYKWEELQTEIPFTITESDLFYFALLKVGENDGGFFVRIHHLVSDAWTFSLLGNQIVDYYSSLKNGKEILPVNRNSYIDYILDEQDYFKSDKFLKDRQFWNEKFNNLPELTSLKPRTSIQKSIKAKRKTFLLPTKFLNKMREFCIEHKTTIPSMFMAGLALYINRVSSKEDILFGTISLNRTNFKEKNTSGMYVSTVPMRVSINGEIDFKTFVQNFSKEWMSCLRHQKYPYELILKEVRGRNSISENIYDIVISYQNARFNKCEQSENYETRWLFNGYQATPLVISINDREDEGRLILDYDYLSDVFHAKEIEFIHDHITRILWHAIDAPDKPISKLEMVSESEKRKILFAFNNTKSDYPREKAIHQLFEQQVEKSPDSIALIMEERYMTYRELNEKANQLAAALLLAKHIKPDDIVAIMVSRSFEMIIGILGILKAGGAYLPIDPEYPEERIKYMLKDSNVKVLLTTQVFVEKAGYDFDVILLDNDKINTNQIHNPDCVNTSKDLAYVIYTSGSTGFPKGVMIEHKSLVNYITWARKVYVKNEKLTFPLFSSLSFDLTVTSIFTPLISGNSIVIFKEDRSEVLIRKVFSDQRINIVKLTPSHLRLVKDLDNSKSNIKRLILGGEDLKTNLAMEIWQSFKGNVEIYNEYGPTETTVGCMIYKYDHSRDTRRSVPIGIPADNTAIYILDKNLNIVPIGIPGELYISGDGVARGYLNKSDLTKQRFIENPFVPGKKLFKTGDLARWFPCGDVAFLGRIDQQVKIRGYRIELGEIESLLLSFPNIKEVIVVERQNTDGRNYLCAYYTSDLRLKAQEISRYLSTKLPNYMIPNYFVQIKKIPMNTNGKIDIKKLPDQKFEICSETDYIAPRNNIERRLACVFANLLEVEKIGIDDNFFEMGGDSLSVINLAIKIKKEFMVDLPLAELYKLQTIRNISEFILNKKAPDAVHDDCLVLIRKGNNNNSHLFFIHAGNGRIEMYSELCEFLSDDYNYWGIRADMDNIYYPQNITIEYIAEKYIEKIRRIQPRGPYNIAGWCIGGTIAFEIVRQFEKTGDIIGFFFIINSIAPMKWNGISDFTINTEFNLVKQWSDNNSFLKNASEFKDIDKLWAFIYKNIDKLDINRIKEFIPDDIAQGIPNYENIGTLKLVKYINIVRVLHNARALYFPNGKIDTIMHYFEAREDKTILNHMANINKWGTYCKNPINAHFTLGDHFSILKYPEVVDLAKIINLQLIKFIEKAV